MEKIYSSIYSAILIGRGESFYKKAHKPYMTKKTTESRTQERIQKFLIMRIDLTGINKVPTLDS